AERTRAGKLKLEEFQGGTFSISNLGMYGIREFAAVINPPQGGILAVGLGEQRPIVRDGQLAVATVMTCTLSGDHRVVDGAGGAPGGYVAAIRAAQLGMKTALVERDQLGGICLNWGCIPTKALLRASEIHHLLRHLDQFGFSAKDITYDPKKVIARSRAVAKQLSNGVGHLMRKNKITVFDGEARLAGKGKIAVAKDGKPVADLASPHIVLATGARARSLPGLEPDGKLVWTYKEAMIPDAIPKSLLVVGSGAIG